MGQLTLRRRQLAEQLEHQLQVLLVLVPPQLPGRELALLVQLAFLELLEPQVQLVLERQLLVLLVLVLQLGLVELLHQELVLLVLADSVDP